MTPKCFLAALFASICFLSQMVSPANADAFDDCYKKVLTQYGPPTGRTWMEKVWQCERELAIGDKSGSSKNRPSSDNSSSATPSKPAQSTANTSNKKNPGKSKYDPRTQEPCVKVVDNKPERLSTGGTRYNYKIANTCKDIFSITIVTRAGWSVPRDVPANRRIDWFCTDGRKENKDCNGGMDHFDF